MDVVVVDIPTKFGMMLSRSWASKLKGTLQMDMLYATILVFREMRRLYRETRLAYMVSCHEHPHNHPIYAVDTDLGSSIFFNDFRDEISEEKTQEILQPTTKKCRTIEQKVEDEGVCKMFFDGACSKEGAGAGVWIKSP